MDRRRNSRLGTQVNGLVALVGLAWSTMVMADGETLPPPPASPPAPVVTPAPVATPAPSVAAPEGRLRLPGEAAATNSQNTGAGSAGLGFEYEFSNGYVRARANLGVAGFDLKDAKKSEYANLILQPDSRGFSFAIDTAFWKSFGESSTGKRHLGGGFGVRVSPTNTWTKTVPFTDPTTMVEGTRTISSPARTASLVAAGVFLWNFPTPEEIPIDLEVHLGASLRALIGEAATNDELLLNTLGATESIFIGFEASIKIRVRDVRFFLNLPVLAASNGQRVPGLTGVGLIVGVEVSGSLFTYELGSPTTRFAVEGQPPPPPPRQRPHLSL